MPIGLKILDLKHWIGMAAGVAALLGAASAAQAEELRAAYEAQAGYALHLLEAGRYGDAEDAAQSLVTAYPNAAFPYALRGAAALSVGSVKFARKDFDRANTYGQEPAAQYGLALCDLFTHDTRGAGDTLAALGHLPLPAAAAGDVRTASAYAALLRGLPVPADLTDGAADDSLAAEIAALALVRTDPKAGAARLAKFLATPSGVPIVREADGLRPLFDPQRPLEPCVVEPELRQMYADRLTGNITAAAKHTGSVLPCSGVVDIRPAPSLPRRTALLSYSVDGEMAAMVNQPPYTWTWNTARVANGVHLVQIQAVDSLGNALQTQTETVRVNNRNGAVTQEADDPGMTTLRTRLWSLLALRPSRKVAEWTLAQSLRTAGDPVGAGAHLLNAAALDPAYKSGRGTARALLGPPPALQSLAAGSGKLKQIALTFDDGPSLAKTPALLDALDKAHAPATFFVVGSRAAEAPEVLRRMARRGDEVENHSYTHPNMNLVLGSDAENEIVRGSVVIQALTGHQPHFFRPPGGNASAAVQRLARLNGLSLAYWTVDAVHYEDLGSPSGLVSYVLAHVHPGSVVLMHNGPEVTSAAVGALVSGLRDRGYTLVTLAEIARGQTEAVVKTPPKMKE